MNECLKEALTFDEDAESRDSRFDLVAEPTNGVDQPLILAVAQLLAQLACNRSMIAVLPGFPVAV